MKSSSMQENGKENGLFAERGNKPLLVRFACVVTSACVALGAWGADADWTYSGGSDGVTITGYTGSEKNLVVPATLDGNAVTAIGAKAFHKNTSLRSITIPGTVKTIGANAFRDCTEFRTVTLNEGLVSIAANAFIHTDLRAVTFPASLERLGQYAFYNNPSLKTVVFKSAVCGFEGDSDWEKNYTYPGPDNRYSLHGQLGEVFASCVALESITFAAGQTFVGKNMFFGCTALKNVNLGSSLMEIRRHAFYGCTALRGIELPTGLETIGLSAFQGCTDLRTISFPPSVSAIGSAAFRGDQNLKTVTFSEGLEQIGANAFIGTGVVSLEFPSTLDRLGQYAFYACPSLKTVTFKNAVRGFDGDVDWDKNYTYPDPDNSYSLHGQLGEAFASCTALEAVTFSDDQEFVGKNMFFGCTALKNITLGTWTAEIRRHAFYGCSALQEIEFPPNLETIGLSAFQGCTDLRTLSFPPSVMTVDGSAFRGDLNLKTVTFGEGLERIGANAFIGTGVVSLEFPSTFDRLGQYAFYSCPSLKTVTFKNAVRGFDGDVDWDKNYTYPDPDNSYSLHGQLGEAFASCTALEAVTFSDDQEFVGKNMFFGCTALKNITLGTWTAEIRRHAFYGCSALQEIEFPPNLETIGLSAFQGCTDLRTLSFPPSVMTIGIAAFRGNQNLKTVTFSEGLEQIGANAFIGTGVVSLEFPSTLDRLGQYAFYACPSLKMVTFESAVRGFDGDVDWAKNYIYLDPDNGYSHHGQLGETFASCTALESVAFSNGQEFLGKNMFFGCTALRNVKLGSSLGEIRRHAFYGCTSLLTMGIPGSVESIGDSAFEACAALRYLTVPNNLSYLGAAAFRNCTALHYVAFLGSEAPTSVGANLFAKTKERMTVYALSSARGWTGDTLVTGFPSDGLWNARPIREASMRPANAGAPYDWMFREVAYTVNRTTYTWPTPVMVTTTRFVHDRTHPVPATEIQYGDEIYLSYAFDEYWRGEDGVALTNRFTLTGPVTRTFELVRDGLGKEAAFWWETNRVEAALTRLPPGAYTLTCELNAGHVMLETDWANNVTSITFRIIGEAVSLPSVVGDTAADVTGDAEAGFVVKPSASMKTVDVTIPEGIDPAKVTVEVSVTADAVIPHGATVRVVNAGHDVTSWVEMPTADASGTIRLSGLTVKATVAQEVLSAASGASFKMVGGTPSLTTAPTKPGLVYTVREGTTLGTFVDGASTVGNGAPWAPPLTAKGTSGFYTIRIGTGR